MHWVRATDLSGAKVLINLEQAISIVRHADPPRTSVLWGAMVGHIGGVGYGRTEVLETPEELFALARVPVGQKQAEIVAIGGGKKES